MPGADHGRALVPPKESQEAALGPQAALPGGTFRHRGVRRHLESRQLSSPHTATNVASVPSFFFFNIHVCAAGLWTLSAASVTAGLMVSLSAPCPPLS